MATIQWIVDRPTVAICLFGAKHGVEAAQLLLRPNALGRRVSSAAPLGRALLQSRKQQGILHLGLCLTAAFLHSRSHFRSHSSLLASFSALVTVQLWRVLKRAIRPTDTAQLLAKLTTAAVLLLLSLIGVSAATVARSRCHKILAKLQERGIDLQTAETAVWRQLWAEKAQKTQKAAEELAARTVLAEASSDSPVLPEVQHETSQVQHETSPRQVVGAAEASAGALASNSSATLSRMKPMAENAQAVSPGWHDVGCESVYQERDGFPLIQGHRGAFYAEPENTMASFEAAVRMGADAVELDVFRTRDDEVPWRCTTLIHTCSNYSVSPQLVVCHGGGADERGGVLVTHYMMDDGDDRRIQVMGPCPP